VLEKEKTAQYEEHIVAEQRHKAMLASHLHSSMAAQQGAVSLGCGRGTLGSVKIFLQPSHSRRRVICGRPAQQHSILHPPPPPPPQTLTNTVGAGVALSSSLRDLPAVAHQQHDTPTPSTL
jgi:hypothetical protein